MRSKLCLLLLALVLLFCGCETDTLGTGNEMTAPLDRILEAMQTNNSSVYESAFPPAFGEQYRAQVGDPQELIRMQLEGTISFDRDRYGEDVQISYALGEIRRYDISLFEPYYQAFAPDFTYAMPLDAITDAAEIDVTVYFEGSYLQEEFDVTYFILCIDGNWYLHPKHFGTVLKK